MSTTYTYSRRNGVRVHTSARETFRYTFKVWLVGVFTTPAAYIIFQIVNH
jgi:hypothetical protein